jgi:tetratricopeptide (TPR) repeat protein
MKEEYRVEKDLFAAAMASYEAGRFDTALRLLGDLIRKAPEHAEAFYVTSIILHGLGKLDLALASIHSALATNNADPRFHHFLGILISLKGQHQDAAKAFRKAFLLQPDNADLAYNLANALKAQGLWEAAITYYEKAVILNANFTDAFFNLGNTYQETGDFDRAKTCFEACLRIQPDFVKAHHNMGVILNRTGDIPGALKRFETVIQLQPDFAEAHNNIGNILLSKNQLDSAVKYFQNAVSIRKDYAEAHYNLGVALNGLTEFEAARSAFTKAINERPGFVEAYNNLGVALQNLGEIREAEAVLNKALSLKPDFAEAVWNRSLVRLLSGDLLNGFKEYEVRFRKPDQTSIYPHSFEVPRWDGMSFKGRRLLVHYEQGFGDTLQFVRYLPMVKSRGGTVIFEVQSELYSLLNNLEGIDSLIEGQKKCSPGVPFDCVIPLLSLPGIFGTRMDTIPQKVPYVFPDSVKAEYWRKRISVGKDFKVGIVWAGNLNNPKGRHRSCSLKHFIPIGGMPSVTLYGLQKGDAVEEIEKLHDSIQVANLADSLTDFSDTCAIIANLDLIISVDTAVAHLAGAMGKPTFVLLSTPCDWRWLLDREDSPWYPTMTLFRQPRKGEWESVFKQVRLAVQERLKGKV